MLEKLEKVLLAVLCSFAVIGGGTVTANAEGETYKVEYQFVSGTEGYELPQDVYDLLPTDDNEYSNGAKVTATNPNSTSVSVDEGVWIFESYNVLETTINNSNITFTGTWKFTKNNTNPVEEIDGDSDTANIKEVSNWDELKQAIDNLSASSSLIVKLTSDMEITSSISIDNAKQVTIISDNPISLKVTKNNSAVFTSSGSGTVLTLGNNDKGTITFVFSENANLSNLCFFDIKNNATLNVNNVLFNEFQRTNNKTSGLGSAVKVNSSSATFNNVEVNKFDGDYGAFLSEQNASNVTFINCKIHDCTFAGNNGGHESGGVIKVTGTSSNKAVLTIDNCEIKNNYNKQLDAWGYANSPGALNLDYCNLNLSKTELSGNRSGQGGAIRAQRSSLILNDVDILNNTIYTDPNPWTNGFGYCFGAGLAAIQCSLTMHDVNISGNKGAFVGGGMMISSSTKVTLDNTVNIVNNEAVFGGGIFIEYNGEVTLDGATINNNKAIKNDTVSQKDTGNYALYNGSGGGVAIDGKGKLNVVSGNITNNSADFAGGGIYVHQAATLNMSGGTVSNNIASGNNEFTNISFTDKYTGNSIFLLTGGTFNLSGNPTIEGDVFLTSDSKINVPSAFTGSNVTINVEKNDNTGEHASNVDGTYQEGRNVVSFASSLDIPNETDISRFVLADRVKNDYFYIRNEEKANSGSTADKHNLELATGFKTTYEFKSSDSDQALPESVISLLPALTIVPKNSEVTPIQPSSLEVQDSTGKWVFKGYDPEKVTNISVDSKFIGTWEYQINETEGDTKGDIELDGDTSTKIDDSSIKQLSDKASEIAKFIRNGGSFQDGKINGITVSNPSKFDDLKENIQVSDDIIVVLKVNIQDSTPSTDILNVKSNEETVVASIDVDVDLTVTVKDMNGNVKYSETTDVKELPNAITLSMQVSTASIQNKAVRVLYSHDTQVETISNFSIKENQDTTSSITFATKKFSNYVVLAKDKTTSVTKVETKKNGYDDGSPFTKDTCGNVFDRWGNEIYHVEGCTVNTYKLVPTDTH